MLVGKLQTRYAISREEAEKILVEEVPLSQPVPNRATESAPSDNSETVVVIFFRFNIALFLHKAVSMFTLLRVHASGTELEHLCLVAGPALRSRKNGWY